MLAAAAMFSIAACSNKIEYNRVPFVTLGVSEINVDEDTVSVKVPVKLYNGEDASVAVVILPASQFGIGTPETDAVAGTNFSIADPADGIIKFTKDASEKEIVLNITKIDGYTGNLNFVLAIEGKTEGVTEGASSMCLCTIKDLDHPLSAMFGNWACYGTSLSEETEDLYYAAFPFTVSPYDGDPTKIWISNIVPMGYYYASYLTNCQVYAEVSNDMKTIKIPVPQTLEKATFDKLFGGGIDPAKLYNWPGFWDGATGNSEPGYITFTYDEGEGCYFTDDSWGIANDDIIADSDWLYYECNIITDAAEEGEPTCIFKL